MKSHEIDYNILGDDIQMVEVELDLQETVIAEAGTMVYTEETEEKKISLFVVNFLNGNE